MGLDDSVQQSAHFLPFLVVAARRLQGALEVALAA
jgi:hypothetical protein